jgi:hypothetical protein
VAEELRAVNAAEMQARTWLEELFGGEPAGLIATTSFTNGNGAGPTSFASSIEEVLQSVIGHVDAYVRLTLLGSRPARGRGTEADSTVMTALWLEADLNGAPDGRGGLVRGAFASHESARALLSRFLEPTMLVRSGYGLHAYWVFSERLDLRSESARARAKALLRGWQEAHRVVAREDFGVKKLDSTHDLARVFRPPGSFNGKSGEPKLVELLAHTGARYSLEEIRGHLDADEVTRRPRAAAQEDPVHDQVHDRARRDRERRAVEELLQAHPRLEQLAKRKGKAPGDGSASDWDMSLACTARREAGASRDEIIELIRHARRLHGDRKGERSDYLQRTADAAGAAVPLEGEGTSESGLRDPGSRIAKAWNLETTIVSGHTVGYGDAASVYLQLADGRELRFPRLAELFDPSVHARRVSLIARSRCPNLTKPRALEVAQWVVELCDTEVDPEEDLDELEGWLTFFRSGLGTVSPGEPCAPGPDRWRALVAVADFSPDPEVQLEIAGRTAAVRDSDGRLWLPAEAFMRHIRQVERAQIDWGTLTSRMEQLGWTRHKIGAREPNVPRESARRIRLSFFVEEQPDGD